VADELETEEKIAVEKIAFGWRSAFSVAIKPTLRGLYRALKNSRFVSGHRFSDAVIGAKSIPASAAAQLEWQETAPSLNPRGT
jgi:hypothetical protein